MKSLSKKIKKYKRTTKKVYIGSGNIGSSKQERQIEPPPDNLSQYIEETRQQLYLKQHAVPVNLLIFDAELKLHQEYSRMFNNIMKVVEDNLIINQESIQEKMKQIDTFIKM
jgi:hypothetical protein